MMQVSELEEATPASIHFATSKEVDKKFSSTGLVVSEGSIANIETERDLFAIISSSMQFPDYFGNNWDALDECLSDMEWLPGKGYLLILRDSEKGWSKSPCILGRFSATWLEAAAYWMEKKTPFHLVFVV